MANDKKFDPNDDFKSIATNTFFTIRELLMYQMCLDIYLEELEKLDVHFGKESFLHKADMLEMALKLLGVKKDNENYDWAYEKFYEMKHPKTPEECQYKMTEFILELSRHYKTNLQFNYQEREDDGKRQ